MKKISFLQQGLVLLVLAIYAFSCVPGSNKNINEVSADTTQVNKVGADSAIRPGDELIIHYKVTDYKRWKKNYDTGDSLRHSFGLSDYIIGRGGKDSNAVICILKMADVKNAGAFSKAAAWRLHLKVAGVVGDPVWLYFERKQIDTAKTDLKERVLAIYKVAAWQNWKVLFDENKPARLASGLHERGVGHVLGDSNRAIIVFAIADVQKGIAFFKSPEIQNELSKEGVQGMPDLFFYRIVQKY